MSFWGLYACCMLFFGILQHYSSRICMCVCWIWNKMRPVCLYSIHIRQVFFSRRRRAVLPTAVSLSVQLILFTSFPHVRGTRCQNAQNWCIYFLLLLKVESWNKNIIFPSPSSRWPEKGERGKYGGPEPPKLSTKAARCMLPLLLICCVCLCRRVWSAVLLCCRVVCCVKGKRRVSTEMGRR